MAVEPCTFDQLFGDFWSLLLEKTWGGGQLPPVLTKFPQTWTEVFLGEVLQTGQVSSKSVR